MNRAILKSGRLLAPMALLIGLAATANAAVPGISGTAFNLMAEPAFINQPDGESIYSWGYGCSSTTGNTFVPAAIKNPSCPTMQVPGPTLVVTEGQTITVTLTNKLPAPVGKNEEHVQWNALQIHGTALAAELVGTPVKLKFRKTADVRSHPNPR